MWRCTFVVCAALIAALALTSQAGAITATFERAGAITSASLGKLTFGPEPILRCNYTLNGEVQSPVTLAVGTQIGTVTEVRPPSSCEGGSGFTFLRLPWRLVINALLGRATDEFTGFLVEIQNMSFNISVYGGIVNCLYGTTGGMLLSWTHIDTDSYVSGLFRMLEQTSLSYVSGSRLCPLSGSFSGTLGLTPQITMRLR